MASGVGIIFTEKKLKSFLNNKELDVRLFNELDSTNNEAKRAVKCGYSGAALIVADSQSAGRGRMGRSFYSPKGTGIYLSYIYKPANGAFENIAITSAAAVAVCRAIKEVTGQECSIKWVNDIYLNGRKVCGILTEAVTEQPGGTGQYIIVGVGINVSTEVYPEDIVSKAGAIGVRDVDRNRLAAAVINNLESLIEGLAQHTFIGEYRRLSMVLGKSVTFVKNGVKTEAVARAVNNDGGLVVVLKNGSETVLNTGEISLII